MKKMTIPADAKRIPLRPLALGEKTGHHHSLAVLDPTEDLQEKVEMYEMAGPDGTRLFLRVTGDNVALTHQEHKPHAIEPGEYEVVIQTEVTDWGHAAVID